MAQRSARGHRPDANAAVQSGEVVSLSVEETKCVAPAAAAARRSSALPDRQRRTRHSALRLKLGLKPLNMDEAPSEKRDREARERSVRASQTAPTATAAAVAVVAAAVAVSDADD